MSVPESWYAVLHALAAGGSITVSEDGQTYSLSALGWPAGAGTTTTLFEMEGAGVIDREQRLTRHGERVAAQVMKQMCSELDDEWRRLRAHLISPPSDG